MNVWNLSPHTHQKYRVIWPKLAQKDIKTSLLVVSCFPSYILLGGPVQLNLTMRPQLVTRNARCLRTVGVRRLPGTRLMSESARPIESPAKHRASLALISILGLGAGYLGLAYYALDHESVYDVVEKYMPGGSALLDQLESWQHKQKVQIREQFYKDDNVVAPYIRERKVHSAKSAAQANVEDPLTPERFFDAQSGTVSLEKKEYLPLMLLPDTRDPLVNRISMSLNDLIQSVNASAASADTVYAVSDGITELAVEIKSMHPKHANLLELEVIQLKDLVDTHESVKKEYQLIHPTGTVASTLPFEMEYHNKLAREILNLERILVSHINTRNNSADSGARRAADLTIQSSVVAISPPRIQVPEPPVIPQAPSSQETKTTKSENPAKPAADWHAPLFKLASSQDFEKILELQLQLTLISAAISNNIGGIDEYVDNMRDLLATSQNKEALLNEALRGIKVPENVDMSAFINEVVK